MKPRQHKLRRPEGNPLGSPGAPGTLRGHAWEYLEDLRVKQRTAAAVAGQAKSLTNFFIGGARREASRAPRK